MDPSTLSDKLEGTSVEFSEDNISRALSQLDRLNWVTLGHYVVVLNGKIDAVIGGEPYLVLQLWLNTKSGQFMGRVWEQTVASGTGVQFIRHLRTALTRALALPLTHGHKMCS